MPRCVGIIVMRLRILMRYEGRCDQAIAAAAEILEQEDVAGRCLHIR